MNFEFILHGKPNNYDSWGNFSFDALEDKVCKEYFDQKEYLPDRGFLVEIRSWKNTFYSICSFIEKVKDTSKRPSYCVVSLIFKGVYCRKCSDLFTLLEEVYDKKLTREAGIIDANHVFQINWFNNAAPALKTIEKLTVDCINSQFTGLFDDIDDTFSKSVPSLSSMPKCNPKDCDSEAFFDDIRKNGRILITESTPSKDSLLAGQISLRKAYDEAQSIASTVPSLKATIQESEKEISQLKSEKNKLSAEKEQLTKSIEEKEQIIRDLKGCLTEKEKEIDYAVEKLREPLEKVFSQIEATRTETKNKAKGWLKIIPYIPVINLLLLLLLSFLAIRSLPSDDKKKEREQQTAAMTLTTPGVNEQINTPSADQQGFSDGGSGDSSTSHSGKGLNANEQVKACDIQITDLSGNILSDNSVIKQGAALCISVRYQQEGYSWHISNGEFSPEQKTNASFIWNVNAIKSGDVIITYRPESEQAKNNNPNKITLKINEL